MRRSRARAHILEAMHVRTRMCVAPCKVLRGKPQRACADHEHANINCPGLNSQIMKSKKAAPYQHNLSKVTCHWPNGIMPAHEALCLDLAARACLRRLRRSKADCPDLCLSSCKTDGGPLR